MTPDKVLVSICGLVDKSLNGGVKQLKSLSQSQYISEPDPTVLATRGRCTFKFLF